MNRTVPLRQPTERWPRLVVRIWYLGIILSASALLTFIIKSPLLRPSTRSHTFFLLHMFWYYGVLPICNFPAPQWNMIL